MWSAGQADDRARFLADLRALRDAAAVGYDELSARTHFPSGILKEAENGPALPTLPILAAYVRACDGDVLEWEERWRRLEFDSRADDGLPIRPAGASPAAVAGTRAASRRKTRGWGSVTASESVTDSLTGSVTGPGSATAEPRVPDSPASWS